MSKAENKRQVNNRKQPQLEIRFVSDSYGARYSQGTEYVPGILQIRAEPGKGELLVVREKQMLTLFCLIIQVLRR